MEAPRLVSGLMKLWDNLELSPYLLLTMAKGAIPPTLALAIYQSAFGVTEFQTIGYLVAIVSIINMCIQPRVPFIKSMIVSAFLTLLGLCISLLAAWCSLKARRNTTPAGEDLAQYNSSASAVSAIWLFFSVWIINTCRAYRPQFTPCIIIYGIFTEISIMQTSRMSNMSEVISFELNFLVIFFIGHGLTTGVNLFIFPTSSRSVALKDIKKYLAGAQKVLKAEVAYVRSFEHSSILNIRPPDLEHQETEEHEFHDIKVFQEPERKSRSPEARELKAALGSLSALHSQLRADLSLAKKDVAWAVLSPDDLEQMFQGLRNLMLPLRGLSVLISIFQRLCEWRGWVVFGDPPTSASWQWERNQSLNEDYRDRQEWSKIFRSFREPMDDLSSDMQNALQHVSIVLGLSKHSWFSGKKDGSDAEKDGSVKPGDPGFACFYASKTTQFHERKGVALMKWMQSKGFELPRPDVTPADEVPNLSKIPTTLKRNDEEQLFVILYIQHLFHGISDAIMDLVKFADNHSVKNPKVQKRLMVPGRKRVEKLIREFFKEVDTSDEVNVGDSRMVPTHIVVAGDKMGLKHHPEHLPPKNNWQVLGNYIRLISHFLASSQSNFGFRAACAVLSVAIIGLLRDTQTFFFNQRCFWAMIIIAISMTPTSGQSLSGLMFRMIGTTAAAILAIANWYIVNGHTAGVIVFFYVFMFLEYWPVIKYPQYIGIWKVTMITQAIIVGYTLQVQKTGLQAPPASNSDHYPIYLIAPYRLACTAAGVLVAFIFTIFPAPVTSRSILRKRLGQSLFLLASYYSAMHATVVMWVSGRQGDLGQKNSPGRRLEKARNKIFAKELVMLAAIRQHSGFSKYEPSIGGDFPATLYDKIIAEIDVILSHMNLVIYATTTSYPGPTTSTSDMGLEPSNDPSDSPPHLSHWLNSLSTLFLSADFNSHNIASLLALLAASVSDAQPLPPYLEPPKPYHLARQMKNMDPQLLSLRHAEDPGYSAFAVTEVSCTMIAESLERLLGHVKDLVGEVDFGTGFLGEKSEKED